MIRFYWISFCTPVGRGGVKFEERVTDAHPFVEIRKVKLARKMNKVFLLNYKPINEKEYKLFIKLNATEV